MSETKVSVLTLRIDRPGTYRLSASMPVGPGDGFTKFTAEQVESIEPTTVEDQLRAALTTADAALAEERTRRERDLEAAYQMEGALVAAESRIAVEASRADVAERRVCELRDFATSYKHHVDTMMATGKPTAAWSKEEDERFDAALDSTADFGGRWVPRDKHDEVLAHMGDAEANRKAAEGYSQRLRAEVIGTLTDAGVFMLADDTDPCSPGEVASAIRRLARQVEESNEDSMEKNDLAIAATRERDAAIAARDEAVATLDEVEEELGAIKEAVTQHLPRYVNENDEDDELDAVETIEQAGRDLALRSTSTHGVSAGTYAKRVEERDAARAEAAEFRQSVEALGSTLVHEIKAKEDAIRARDEVGIQYAAAQAVIARMQPVVEAARVFDDAENWDDCRNCDGTGTDPQDHKGRMRCGVCAGSLKVFHDDCADEVRNARTDLRDALQARLDDYEDDHRAVVVGQCAPDERHCSCVPYLRREVEAMRGVEAAARAINGILNGDVTEEMRAITDALRALDALRTRKVGG